MITTLIIILIFLTTLLVWFFIHPVRYFGPLRRIEEVYIPPDLYVYSFVLHIHTQYSFDSLGKPEDLIKALEEENIDYALVTDHDNTEIEKENLEKVVAGKEVKLNDERGNLLGDLLEINDIKVVAHHFREKYRWKLPKDRDLFFELIDLRDALFKSKVRLFLYISAGLMIMPFMKRKVVKDLSKLVDTLYYAKKYFEDGWRSRILGGHDHHVLLYFRDVKSRFLFPDYRDSFSIMRNLLLTWRRVKAKEDLISSIKDGFTLISFSDRNSYCWIEDGFVMATSPYQNTVFILLKEGNVSDRALGANYRSQGKLKKGYYMLLGFTYRFRLGGLLFDVRPLFISDLIEVN